MITRYLCPFECGWSMDVSAPMLRDMLSMEQPVFGTLKDHVQHLVQSEMDAADRRMEGKLAEHLDAEHAGWTYECLAQLARDRERAAQVSQAKDIARQLKGFGPTVLTEAGIRLELLGHA